MVTDLTAPISDQEPELQPVQQDQMHNKWYRLNTLYHIVDKYGKDVLFKPNRVQRYLFSSRWYRNMLLKARQLGCTTFIAIVILDECLFNPNKSAGFIAHTRTAASEILATKIFYPYDHLPDDLKAYIKTVRRSTTHIEFSNGSSIRCDTSMISRTLNYLHVSELGRISVKHPEKANEIISASTQAVPKGGHIWVESTAEGKGGSFFEQCKIAQDMLAANIRRSPLDFRFLFAGWFHDDDYQLDEYIKPSREMVGYFKDVCREANTKLTVEQINWYLRMRALLGDDVLQQYPSTPQEAFLAKLRGTYFSTEFRKIRSENRITTVPYEEMLPVSTAWDFGVGEQDTTVIWFFQEHRGQIRFIDYYENSGEGLPHYASILEERAYVYDTHFAPHDIAVLEIGSGKTRIEQAAALGIHFERVPRVKNKADSIEAARKILSQCWFDETACEDGIEGLEGYRKEWDDHLGVYKRKPLHDKCSNPSDAFQCMAMGHSSAEKPKRSRRRRKVDAMGQ